MGVEPITSIYLVRFHPQLITRRGHGWVIPNIAVLIIMHVKGCENDCMIKGADSECMRRSMPRGAGNEYVCKDAENEVYV
jgi:hypothetical protein